MDPHHTSPVIATRNGSLGRIHLNRPKALNSLTLEMVRLIDTALDAYEADPEMAAVLITGEGPRAFCAGGDILALRRSAETGDGSAARFWTEEYRLNARIPEYPKPYIALMTGITMGGGVGLSAHGGHRVVCETSRIAMPETGIGLLPDVGGTWLLPQAPGRIGIYLGLTGEQIDAGDAIHARLADVFVPQDRHDSLIDSLAALSPGAGRTEVDEVLARFAATPPPSRLAELQSVIDEMFSGDSVPDIRSRLDQAEGEAAAAFREALSRKSPTCLAVTFRLLQAGRTGPDLRACLAREFAEIQELLIFPDFREGVRAAIIDKDRNPTWQPLQDIPHVDAEMGWQRLFGEEDCEVTK